jgi:hypothetical protein
MVECHGVETLDLVIGGFATPGECDGRVFGHIIEYALGVEPRRFA